MVETKRFGQVQIVQDVRWFWQTYGTEIVFTILGIVIFGGWAHMITSVPS